MTAPNPPYNTVNSIFSPPDHPQFGQSQQPQDSLISQQQQQQLHRHHQQQPQQTQTQPQPQPQQPPQPQQAQPRPKQPRKPRQPRKQAQQQQPQQQQQQQEQQQQVPVRYPGLSVDPQRFAQLEAEVGQLHQLVQGIIHRLDAFGVPPLPGGHHAPLLIPGQHVTPVSGAGTSSLAAATANAATSNTFNFNSLLQTGTATHDGSDVGVGGGGVSSASGVGVSGVGGVTGLVSVDHGGHHDGGSSSGNIVLHQHHQESGMDNAEVGDDDDEEARQIQLLSADLVANQTLQTVPWDGGTGTGTDGGGGGGASSGSANLADPAGFDMAYPRQGHIFHIQLSTSAGGKNYVGGGPNGASVVVNNWTRQHGYRVITRRSKIKNDRYHLTMACALSGNKYRPVPGPTQEQIEEARRNGQRKPYQRRIGTDKCNCPFRFVLRETAKHSSIFEVRWTMLGPNQRPPMHNHGPDPKAMAADE